MEAGQPSRTAQGAALHRAAHQLVDTPIVFPDPLALRIVGEEAEAELRAGRDRHSTIAASVLRAFIAARSRYTEDSFAAAFTRGMRQYVVLGAGLDTFAYRRAALSAGRLAIFEIDHPATQAWKRTRLAETGIAVPAGVTFAPVNFETETLGDGLARAGFDTREPAFFAWLGVVPYLSEEAVRATLSYVAQSLPAESEIVFDYAAPAPADNKASGIADLAERVAAIGEPLRSFFEPAALAEDALRLGFTEIEDLDAMALNARYFRARKDGLAVRGRGHVMKLRV